MAKELKQSKAPTKIVQSKGWSEFTSTPQETKKPTQKKNNHYIDKPTAGPHGESKRMYEAMKCFQSFGVSMKSLLKNCSAYFSIRSSTQQETMPFFKIFF